MGSADPIIDRVKTAISEYASVDQRRHSATNTGNWHSFGSVVRLERCLESFAESRNLRPILLGIAGSIPGISGVAAGADAAILAHVQQQQQDRLNYLIECLESGTEDFCGPISIQRSEPAIHAAYVTIEATLRTSRREKIRAFARLLQAGVEVPPRLDLETEHEDYLKILDELSVRELQLLYLLNEYGDANPRRPDDNNYDWSYRHWDDFIEATITQLGIPREEVSGLLVRLTRTGTFEPIYVSAYGGQVNTVGMVTGAYKRLAELLGNDQDLFDTGTIVR